MRKFRNFCFWAIGLLAAICFLALFAYSLYGGYRLCDAQAGDYPYFIRKNLPLTCVLLLLGIAVLYAVYKSKLPINTAIACTLLLTLAGGTAFALTFPMMPRFDAAACRNLAVMLLNGETEKFTASTYLNGYPFQLGYVLYRALLLLLFGEQSYLATTFCNLGFLLLLQGCILFESRRLFENSRCGRQGMLLLCLMMLTCLQPLMLITLHYGNLPGISLAVCGTVMVLHFTRKPSLWRAAAAVVLLSLSCLLKLNNSIVCLALCLCLLLYALTESKRRALHIGFGLCMLLPMLAPTLLQRLMETLLHHRFGTPVPMLAWLAMGMHDSNRMWGWYDGFTNFADYVPYTEAENRARVMADLQQHIGAFAESPMECFRFFKCKITSTWLETSFGCLQTNYGANRSVSLFPEWGRYLFQGRRGELFAQYFDTWTQLLYLGFGLGSLRLIALKNRDRRTWLAPLITAVIMLGAFFYHALFETKSQYIFTYLLLMLPLSCYGLLGLMNGLDRLLNRLAEAPKNRNGKNY